MSFASLPTVEDRLGTIPEGTPPPAGVKRLAVLLINPSKYDDEGYVLRFVRGVLPSNTLAALASLTEDVESRGDLGPIEVETVVLDEHVQKIRVKALARRCRRRGTRGVVALCGVQTNQFPRAVDLARKFRAEGLPLMIGGFHVSGAVALSGGAFPEECRQAIEDGITLVKGEVEECWGDLLRDALHGSLRPFYDVATPPDLTHAAIPAADPKLMKRFAHPRMGTIDAGRGCPFDCSFCTIVNVQGRRMRCRSAAAILDRIRKNAARRIDYYFFTDDNFARNPEWEAILDALIALRASDGIAIEFMMQVDVLAHRLPGFVEKAAEAGCTQVFIGVETLNPANLAAAHKKQNRVENYREMVAAWHERGIACHAGYIIGFPHDTPESVKSDVRRLRDEIEMDQASFFMLTPIPGSKDHVELRDRGEWMDADYNRFDSFHTTMRHPRMTSEEWLGAFRDAWEDFYSVEGMKAILERANDRTYWGLFKNFIWYRYANEVERTPPMLCGFLRIRDRGDLRPGAPARPLLSHLAWRTRETYHWARRIVSLYFELQEVWLATRSQTELEAKVGDLRKRYAAARERLGESASRAGESLGRGIAGVRASAGEARDRAIRLKNDAAESLAAGIERVRRRAERPAWRRALHRINLLAIHRPTRADIDAYWKQTIEKLRHGRVHRINPFKLAWIAFRDAKRCAAFNLSLMLSHGK